MEVVSSLRSGIFLFMLAIVAIPAQSDSIKVVSEEWKLATESSGVGLYWDILRKVYESQGIDLEYQIVSYARGVKQVLSGEADAWVGASLGEEEQALYAALPLDIDLTYALYKPGTLGEWKGAQSLANRKVGWVKGYDYQQDLGVPMQVTEFVTRKVGFKRLESGEIEVIVDAKYDLEQEAIQLGVDLSGYQLSPVMEQPIYIAFNNSEKGKRFKSIFDRELARLRDNGELRALFDKYQWQTYPFN
ncbi:transporter substrate-binding domain-containing protein [Aliiglaciecola sp. CAU 1673]|uniref:substrate-binding periplasmic protein n=1 Tax=Aliiglaciecola sp. CAU 1673 TaxID=3032595 RepID=UPI0023D9F26E|nr:transporter substrate-binding domain-containing protein [Aliiglaciecola sp. CAU 1673]MDF2177211.1 transporter substrate-binding domain-containing protein [Aliiglaciecola sp. CAU 1673]